MQPSVDATDEVLRKDLWDVTKSQLSAALTEKGLPIPAASVFDM
jgi:hypothetical protein